LELLQSRAEGRGDLPVFRASVLEVIKLGEDTQCAASDIARIILQDPGFAVKVLRVANTTYYNRTDQPIKTISRAVVLLGVEVVRDISLGLGFVEVFQKHHPWIDFKKILARSYFAATLAREFGQIARDSNREEVFLAGLLQYLGPLAVAYYLPEKYLEVEQYQQKWRCSSLEAERQVLGYPFPAFGEALASRWALPKGIARSLQEKPPSDDERAGRLLTIAKASRRIAENLFTEGRKEGEDFAEAVDTLQKALNLDSTVTAGAIEAAFSEARKSAGQWGLEAVALNPIAGDKGENADPSRENVIRLLNKAIRRESLPSQVELLEQDDQPKDKAALQLDLLREISMHIFENRDLSTLFDLVMEGIQKVAKFDRIVLALCSPDRSTVNGRYGFGIQANELAVRIQISLDVDNLFTRCLKERRSVLVLDAEKEPFPSLLPPYLTTVFHARSFAVSPLFSAEKLVGLLYADNAFSGKPIELDGYRCFEHFTLQANLGLDRHRLRL